MTGDFGQRFDLFRKTLKESHRIKTRELAEALGVSPSYLTDLAKGRIKAGGLRLWDGIRKTYAEWEPYLRGTVNKPPSSARTSGERYPAIDSSPPTIPEIFEERPRFNRRPGLTREESDVLTRWLAADPEAKALLVAWARARLDDSFQDADAAKLIEIVAKAVAHFLLGKRERGSVKESPPEG